jgi:Spy/CpxP family protein refolding chaperone
MKTLFSLTFVLALLIGAAVMTVGQDTARPSKPQEASTVPDEDYTAKLREMFAPLTAQLSLTKAQESRIVAIIAEVEVRLDPLREELNSLGEQLMEAAMTDTPDERTINLLSARQAQLLSRIISLKVRAFAGVYRLLTPNQRALLARQFRGTNQIESNLGTAVIH